MQNQTVFFWKPYPSVGEKHNQHIFSQWYDADQPFLGSEDVYVIDDISKNLWELYIYDTEFTTREVWMMYCKALLFAKDQYQDDNIKLAQRILVEKSQKKIQNYGRAVKGFNQALWDKWKYKIVVNGNYLQFSQNENMKKILLDTGNLDIAESSPIDGVWGLKLNADQASKTDKINWPGTNLLGLALHEVRNILKNE